MTVPDSAQTLADRLAHVEARMAKAARTVGRAPGETRLVAVSKTHDAEMVRQAIAAGQRIFGENRVQEAQGKFPALKAEFPDLELHLIGPLQTNKAKDAVALFDVIQTVDREKLAAAIADAGAKLGRSPRCFIQVNTGEEEQKAGCLPGETDALVRLARETYHLDVVGLMCIPPVDEEPSLHFALLRRLGERNGLKELSMGMSGDYEAAIRLGATYVRVGTAIFGARPPLQA